MSVKGRRIVVPPFFGSFLPSSPTSQKERLAFVLTVEHFRICLLIDKLFSKAIFQLFLLDSSHQPEPLCKVSKLTFLLNEINILLLGIIYRRKTEKSSMKSKFFFYIYFSVFLSNISITVRRSFPSARRFNFSFSSTL